MYEEYMNGLLAARHYEGKQIVATARQSVAQVSTHSVPALIEDLQSMWGRPRLLDLNVVDKMTPVSAMWKNLDGQFRVYSVNRITYMQRTRTNAASREVSISASLLEAARARRTCNFKSAAGNRIVYDGRAATENGGSVYVPVLVNDKLVAQVDADTSMRKPLTLRVDIDLGAHSFVVANTYMKPALEYLINVY